MKLLLLCMACMICSQTVMAQTQTQAPPTYAPTSATHVIETPTADSAHGKAAAKLPKSKNMPNGHSEKPITIKPVSGTIFTKECGALTELTVLHRSHEPAMLAHVLQAAKDGKTLLLADAKCLDSGKAVASSISLMPAVVPEMSLVERCRLPFAKERISSC